MLSGKRYETESFKGGMRLRRWRGGAFLIAAMAALFMPAAGLAERLAASDTQAEDAASQPVTQSGSAADGYLFNLSEAGRDFGQELKEHGIYLSSASTFSGATIASGGLKKGHYGTFQHTLGVNLDLQPLLGLDNAVVHTTIVKRYGVKNNRAYHGSAYAGLAIAGPVETTRLTELSVDLSLLDDRLRLLVGRAPSATEYATSDLYCSFSTGICGHVAPFAWSRNSNAGFWPLASWTMRATIKPTPATYVRFGISDVNTAGYSRPGFPWNGGWSLKQSTGVFLPVEIGYRTSFADDSHPRAINIGGYYDSSPYDDPYYNEAGQSFTLHGGTRSRHKGRASVYVQAQKMLWRPDPSSRRGLHLFGAALMGVHGIEQTKYHMLAGLVATGPFASRPNDTLGVMGFMNRFDRRVWGDYQASLIKTGQGGKAPRGEVVMELNYGFAAAPGIQVRPFMQQIFRPDQIGFRPVVASNRHAMTVGLQVSASVAELFGLPVYQRRR
ncbi:MAG TPA: carbohydrate porin [Sphingobium sp.]|nr:carbohydrate porin [Sphingobium sp.]